jgi:hypothetical protein
MKKVLFLLLFALPLSAQQDLGTYFLSGLHQSVELNPSFDTKEKIVISLPSAFVSFHQQGISISSFLKGELLVPISERRHQVMFGSNISVLQVSYKHRNIRYNFAHNFRTFTDFQFSNPLIALLLNGNESTIGGRATFSPSLAASAYRETVLGASYIGAFSIGANLKILNGIRDISSEVSDFSLAVNDDIYQLDMMADVLINSSFPIDFSNTDLSQLGLFNFIPRNFGLAFDIGANYKNGPFTFAASAIDIGYLNWNDSPKNYEAKGRFVYDGVSITELLNGDFDFLDTIGSSIVINDLGESYSNFVPAKFYANVNYQIRPDLQFGGLVYGHSNYKKVNAALAFNLQKSWKSKHVLAIQYAVIGSNPLNLGVSAYTTLGPVQLYGVFDNVLAIINTLGAENSSFRIGMNLVFNKERETTTQYAFLD